MPAMTTQGSDHGQTNPAWPRGLDPACPASAGAVRRDQSMAEDIAIAGRSARFRDLAPKEAFLRFYAERSGRGVSAA